jgi:hypothetical protein
MCSPAFLSSVEKCLSTPLALSELVELSVCGSSSGFNSHGDTGRRGREAGLGLSAGLGSRTGVELPAKGNVSNMPWVKLKIHTSLRFPS